MVVNPPAREARAITNATGEARFCICACISDSTCTVSINVQRLSVEAAMTGNIDTLKLAVLHDPLVGAICTPDEVWQMVDEMVVAQAQWLPQYADAVSAAKARLAKSTIKTREWEGAARRSVRSVEELREMKGAHH